MSLPAISFPEDDASVLRNLPALGRQKTLVYLVKLLRRTGYSVAIITIACILIVKPLLCLNFDRRLDFMKNAFKKATAIYSRASKSIKFIPSVEVKYNGTVYKDEMVTTDDFSVQAYSYIPGNWSNSQIPKELSPSIPENENYNERGLRATERLSNSLLNMKRTLDNMNTPEYKKSDSYSGVYSFRSSSTTSEMQSLLFQLKQLKNYTEVVNADHPRDYFFKRSPLQGLYTGLGDKKGNYMDNLEKEIKECHDLIEQIHMTKPKAIENEKQIAA
ncbi:DEKNAAC104519 [Brettanomyces naardenensis]|uniref:DEKNAAC104519 n=1 Tax=Brettanomyces naardenensis TaxID=13370 RepID=A0A448YRQ5_BRENA|nr:DEKNAAC104519 [Brettanomyces naardenensis]